LRLRDWASANLWALMVPISEAAQSSDPGWFYSSLAQVTAALVGFLGGFLILRLLTLMEGWRTLLGRLAQTDVDWRWKRTANETEVRGTRSGVPIHVRAEEERLWFELQRLMREKDQASIPKAIWRGVALLGLLSLVGIAWPLMALDAPAGSTRALMLAVCLVLVAGLLAVALIEGSHALGELSNFKMSDDVEKERAQRELDIEAQARREG
jgi:hypothetical protein